MLLFQGKQQNLVVTLSGRFRADLLGAFWGDLVDTFSGDLSGHLLLSPGAATVAMQFCLWGVRCPVLRVASHAQFCPDCSYCKLAVWQHDVIFYSKYNDMVGVLTVMSTALI